MYPASLSAEFWRVFGTPLKSDPQRLASHWVRQPHIRSCATTQARQMRRGVCETSADPVRATHGPQHTLAAGCAHQEGQAFAANAWRCLSDTAGRWRVLINRCEKTSGGHGLVTNLSLLLHLSRQPKSIASVSTKGGVAATPKRESWTTPICGRRTAALSEGRRPTEDMQ